MADLTAGNLNMTIAGKGEMADRVRNYDWSKTVVGPIENWPKSLLTTVNIMLSSRFPMFLWWGESMLQFYNDAYRPSLGQDGKHPRALGTTGYETWQEIWHIIKPMIDSVMETGEATWSEDQLVPIYRNGKLEDVYWTFCYSAVYDDDGNRNGILVVCNETTEKVITTNNLRLNKEKLQAALTAAENSEANIRNLIMQAPVPVCILQGKDFVVEVANEGVCEIWGKKHEEVINKPIFEGLPEARSQGLEDVLTSVYQTGERFVAYERPVNLPRNGKIETVFLNFVYEAMRDSQGAISGVMAVATDVTAQVHARLTIEESEREFRQLADSLPHIVWTADPTGYIDYYNKQWYDFTGFDESYGDPSWIPILHPDDVQIALDKYYHSIKTGDPYLIEYRFRDVKNGGFRWFLGKAQPIRDAEGNIIKWFGSSTDIDVQKSFSDKLEQKVNERTVELQKMNGELQNFAYVASHDLQEPLRKIQTYSDRILQKETDNLSGNGKEYFRRLQSAANRMQSLINDLLDYSRTNNTELKVEFVELDAILNEVLNEMRDVIKEKNATITFDHLCSAHVIPFQFRQVMQNLISNSLKFSKPGISPVVKVHAQIKTGQELLPELSPLTPYCHISFTDNGIGFEPEYRFRIFEMFQRLNGRSEYEGTGIGLAIVNKIIENHKGVITADSKPGEGTTFDIYIPH